MIRNWIPSIVMLGFLVCLANDAQAQVASLWNAGGADDRWDNAANWSAGVPTAADLAIFTDAANPQVAEIDGSTAAVASRVLLGDSNVTDDSTINMTGGTLNVGGMFDVGWVGKGTFNLTGGTATVGTRLGFGGSNGGDPWGTVTVDGGTLNVLGDTTLGVAVGASSTKTQQLNMISGIMTSDDMYIGDESNATARVDMTGGTMTVGDLGVITNSSPANVNGHFQLDGGILSITNPTPAGQGTGGLAEGFRIINDIGSGGTQNGSFDITDGTLLLAGDATATLQEYILNDILTGFGDNGIVEFDFDVRNAGLTTVTASPSNSPATVFTWKKSGLGDWADANNWSKNGLEPPGGMRANNPDHTAVFPDNINITAPTNVSTNAAVTVNSIEFNNATHNFVVSGLGSVTMAKDSLDASPSVVVVPGGQHEFQAPVMFQDDGQINVASGGSLNFFNELNLGANTLSKTGDGTLAVNSILNTNGGGTLNCLQGTCSGSGTMGGNLSNTGGTVSPGNSPGILTIDGDYTQGGGGTLALEIGGTVAGDEYDRLVVNGTATLDGTLDVSLINGFTLDGESFTFDVLDFNAVVGDFATFNLPAGLMWNVNDGTLSTGGGCPGCPNGDFNASNLVDAGDLNLVLFNWNEVGANLPTGPDGWTHQRPGDTENVGADQLNLVLFNWNEMGSATAAVPEPNSLCLLLMATALLRVRKRSRRGEKNCG